MKFIKQSLYKTVPHNLEKYSFKSSGILYVFLVKKKKKKLWRKLSITHTNQQPSIPNLSSSILSIFSIPPDLDNQRYGISSNLKRREENSYEIIPI